MIVMKWSCFEVTGRCAHGTCTSVSHSHVESALSTSLERQVAPRSEHEHEHIIRVSVSASSLKQVLVELVDVAAGSGAQSPCAVEQFSIFKDHSSSS